MASQGTEAVVKRLLSLNGIFALRKPVGESSAKSVERVKTVLLSNVPKQLAYKLKKQLKVGHGGTLDPLASGVLVIGLGGGCKMLHKYLHGTSKSYRAIGRFGDRYDTYDSTGMITGTRTFEHIKREDVEAILKEKFKGEIMQRPPAFSALHINGERAYDLARKRQHQLQKASTEKVQEQSATIQPELELPARPVTISRITLTKFELPEFELEMECSSGTYVRSIIHDLGEAFDSYAAMFQLERTAQGPFKIEDCLDIDIPLDIDIIEGAMRTQ
jgi:tRNA pseudouridine55 synthase